MNNKKAFSTAELMLMLVLTGILISLGMGVMRHTQSNYRHLYYAAYNNLKHSAGELMAVSTTGKLPTGAAFCTGLADLYNLTSASSACTFTYDLSPSTTFTYSTPNISSPSFSLSNGQRYYVGNAFKPVGTQNYFNVPAIMVAVDLNGTAKPNIFDTRVYVDQKTPDIVAFAILENGVVMPMSPMADMADYIHADVQQCDLATGCPSSITQNIIYKRVPIRQALSVSNSFPPYGGTLGVQYNTDTTYSFKKSYTVDARCTTGSFCKVIIDNPVLGGIGSML